MLADMPRQWISTPRALLLPLLKEVGDMTSAPRVGRTVDEEHQEVGMSLADSVRKPANQSRYTLYLPNSATETLSLQCPLIEQNEKGWSLLQCSSCLHLVSPWGLAILVKFGPLEEAAPFLTRRIPGMTHPHIPPKILSLFLDAPKYSGHAAMTFRSVFRMKAGLVVPVCDIDTLIGSGRMRIDSGRRRYGMLPSLLHLGMHHEQAVMRQMD